MDCNPNCQVDLTEEIIMFYGTTFTKTKKAVEKRYTAGYVRRTSSCLEIL